MTPADRPSDDARAEVDAEAIRLAPVDDVFPSMDAQAHYRCGFRDGAEWAASRAETTTESRCPDCGGIGSHGFVHARHGNGGGSNRPCPRAETTTATVEDAIRQEVEYRLRTTAAYFRMRGKHGEDPEPDFLATEIAAATARLTSLLATAPTDTTKETP